LQEVGKYPLPYAVQLTPFEVKLIKTKNHRNAQLSHDGDIGTVGEAGSFLVLREKNFRRFIL
jgi:hypothetical protein